MGGNGEMFTVTPFPIETYPFKMRDGFLESNSMVGYQLDGWGCLDKDSHENNPLTSHEILVG